MRRYVLIDFMNMAFRAHYGYDAQMSFTGENGVPTGMTYGLLTMTLAVIRDTRATHVAFAGESRIRTFNWTLVDEASKTSDVIADAFKDGYKGNRKSQDSEFSTRLKLTDEACEAMQWPVYRVPGYEADDTLASLALKITEQGDSSIIVTGDQDLWQCVTDTCYVWAPKQGGTYLEITPQNIGEFLGGLDAGQISAYKALVGDKSDGYPGCPGIGSVGAEALLKKYGDLTSIYASIDEIKGATQRKLIANKDLVIICSSLAELNPYAPVEFEPDLGKIENPAPQSGFDFVRRHSMKSLEKRLGYDVPDEVIPYVPNPNMQSDDDYKEAVATWK